MILIPLPDKPFFDIVVDIEGTDYLLTMALNQRDDVYYCSIADAASGEPIVSGVRCSVGTPLLQFTKDARLPGGELFFLDTQGEGKDPSFGDLSSRCLLYYITAGELNA